VKNYANSLLTGLFNRRYLDAEIEMEQLRLKRNQISIGFIMIDIDHFKKFNDTFGHDAGDFVLKNLSKFILDRAREGDIACRYGGEEFILGMHGATLEILKERAEMLRNEVKGISLEYQGQQLNKITLSIGAARYPEHGHTLLNVINAADKALYKAKESGRNCVVICDK
jgi:diguanylate cyclase (GGDEF)-like protein